MITWTVLTDGRDYIFDTLPRWIETIEGDVSNKFIVDDSGSAERRLLLAKTFKDFTIVPVAKDKAGYSPAMNTVMQLIAKRPGYGFLLEDDFLPNQVINLNDLITVLELRPHVAEVVLKRQPWFGNEVALGPNGMVKWWESVGNIMEQHSYKEINWFEHKSCWSCNPCLFSSETASRPWPSGLWSESVFGQNLIKAGKVFSMLGKIDDAPVVEHIGAERNGVNY